MDTANPLEQIDSRPSGRSFFVETPSDPLLLARFNYYERTNQLGAQNNLAFLACDPQLIRETQMLIAVEQDNFERRVREIKKAARSAGGLAINVTIGGEDYHEGQ